MNNNKISIKVERTLFHKSIEIISLIILSAILTDTVLSLGELPELVPIYVGFDGVLNGFISNKFAVLVFSVFALISIIVCNLFSMKPSILSYKVKITEENYKRQYSLATNYMKILGLELVMLFSYLQFKVTRATLAGVESIGSSYLLFLVIILISSIIYSILSKRNK